MLEVIHSEVWFILVHSDLSFGTVHSERQFLGVKPGVSGHAKPLEHALSPGNLTCREGYALLEDR